MKLRAICVFPLVIGLTACGGGSSTTSSLFAVDHGTPSEALAADLTITVPSNVIVRQELHYSENTAENSSGTTPITFKRNASGDVRVVFEGEEFTLGEDAKFLQPDGTSYGFEIIDDAKEGTEDYQYIGLWSWSGTLNEVFSLDRDSYAQIWNLWANKGTGEGGQTIFVVGTETKAEVLGGFNLVEYAGNSHLFLRQTDATPMGRAEFDFNDARLSVNFKEDSVSGSFGGTRARLQSFNDETQRWETSEYSDIGGGLNIINGSIDGNSFSAEFVADQDLSVLKSLAGTVNGKFYGPEGENLAGVLSGSGLNNSDDAIVAVGHVDLGRAN